MRLNGTSDEEISKRLTNRYESQLSRVRQNTPEDVFQTYMNALAQTFDPHTNYFTPHNSENFDISMSRSLEGIGAVLQYEDGYTKVVRLVPGGPAAILAQCGHRLRHLHLHGFKDGRDHHPPLVDGDEIQWRELFEMVRTVNYPGDFNFEPQGMLADLDTLDYIERAPEGLAALASLD